MHKIFKNVIQTPDGISRILLYGDVGEGCHVDSARVVAELMSIEASSTKIEVHINSRGGDVFEGIAIYNALAASQADISIYIDGIAASIAAIIALCGKPLYMARHSKLMLHAVSGGAYGNAEELRRMAQLVEDLQVSLANMIAQRCGDSPEHIVAKYFRDGVDHWISASEAEVMGLVDGVVDGPAVPPSEKEEEIYNFINQYNQDRMVLENEIKNMPVFSGKKDDEIIASIKRHADSAAVVENLKKTNQELQDRVAALEAKEVDAILNQAVAEGKITKEQKAVYAKLMASDRENTEALLASMPKASTKRIDNYVVTDDTKGGGLSAKSWDELDKAGLLTELKAQDPVAFAAKYKERFGAEYKE